MLAGYGELEYLLAVCLGYVLGDRDRGIQTYFRIISESTRLTTADSLMRKPLLSVGLGNQYAEVRGAFKYCLKLRNTYAHCHWADWPRKPGLYYVNLQEATKSADSVNYTWYHVDEALLSRQEVYFSYAGACVDFLGTKLRYEAEKLKAPLPIEWPAHMTQPAFHNPKANPPPWLSTEAGTWDEPQA